jgi:hypothetical protein
MDKMFRTQAIRNSEDQNAHNYSFTRFTLVYLAYSIKGKLSLRAFRNRLPIKNYLDLRGRNDRRKDIIAS